MRDYIEKFRNDPETAFSHTISKDLSDAGSMTAVTFRKQFGRPKYSDWTSDDLTCQKIDGGAVVCLNPVTVISILFMIMTYPFKNNLINLKEEN